MDFLKGFFFFWMVKGNHFTTSTPLWAASESLTYHPNFVNALLFNDLASARADVQFVPRNAVPQHFCMLHVWQHLHQSSRVEVYRMDLFFLFFSLVPRDGNEIIPLYFLVYLKDCYCAVIMQKQHRSLCIYWEMYFSLLIWKRTGLKYKWRISK